MRSCPTCKSTYPPDFALCPRDGTPLQDVGVWSEGTVVRGKYRILSKVGEGGMGAVYKALHLRFNELRALKVISVALSTDSSFLKRFEKEAVLTRKLQHPNAVRVDDIDEAEDGRPFIVMEYIEGPNLKKVIADQGTLPLARVLPLVKQIASALSAAHQLGMVHRDIKAENIILIETAGGEQAKVLDFGIAKIKEASAGALTLTETGIIIGSPPYMSPEQAMGMKGDQLDGRSDLYSLGVVMYQMLTGALPLKADTTMSMLMAHIQTPPLPIRRDLRIPEAISTLVMRLLEKKPDARPPSGQAVIEAIERAEKESAGSLGATIVAAPQPLPRQEVETQRIAPPRAAASPRPGPPGVEPRPAPSTASKKFRWRTWAIVAIALILLAGGVVWWRILLMRRQELFVQSHRLGHTLMQKRDLDGAIREYRNALKLRPDLDHVRLDLALALQAKGQLRAAFEEFEVVCTRQPQERECRENYRTLMKQLKETGPRP